MAITFFTIISLNIEYTYMAVLLILLYALGMLIPVFIEWGRKKEFYNHLMYIYENLKLKNLLTEMIVAPGFTEGIILYEILKGSNKAHIEEINRYKDIQEQYREYIEALGA